MKLLFMNIQKVFDVKPANILHECMHTFACMHLSLSSILHSPPGHKTESNADHSPISRLNMVVAALCVKCISEISKRDECSLQQSQLHVSVTRSDRCHFSRAVVTVHASPVSAMCSDKSSQAVRCRVKATSLPGTVLGVS